MEQVHYPLTALSDESRALSAVLREVGPDDFGRATNCPPWTLDELVVHIAMSIYLDEDPPVAPAPPTATATATAADYYRRPERDTLQYRQSNVDRTTEVARDVLAETSSARWFEQVSQESRLAAWALQFGPIRCRTV